MGKSTDEFNASYNDIRNKMKRGVGAHEAPVEKGEVMWAVLEATAAILDGVLGTKRVFSGPVCALSQGGLRGIYDCIQAKKFEPAAIPNPWFVWNGHDDLE